MGRLPTWTAVLVLAIGAVIGVILTVIADREPGNLLGFFVIMGSIAAALGIQRGKAYLLFPVPALAFFVAAIVAGKVHDAKLGSSTASLGAGFTQWVAGIFFPAVVATIFVVLIGGCRFLLGRQLVTGQSLVSPGAPVGGIARSAPAPRRPPRKEPPRKEPVRKDRVRDDPDRDSWADENPFADQQAFKTQMMPAARPDGPAEPERPAKPGGAARMGGQGGGADRRSPRPPRDRNRPERDAWGEPRSDPRPRSNGQSQPRDGTPRPSFNPKPSPPRKDPPQDWNQR